jgi:uncharacterized GH25 family protein
MKKIFLVLLVLMLASPVFAHAHNKKKMREIA